MTVQQLKFDTRVQIPATGITIALTLLFPFLAHVIGGPTAGAQWLPLFYAPLVAAMLFHPGVALVAGLVTPMVNHLLTGMPPLPMAVLLSVELLLFGLMVQGLYRWRPTFRLIAPLAYILTKIIELALLTVLPLSVLPMSPWQFFSTSMLNAVPGLLVLLLINGLMVKGLERDR